MASGDTVFRSTSFNEGKGDYHTRCYYTDITNTRREAGFVEQHLLRGFLSAWLGAGQPLGNWTFYTFKEDEDEERIYDNRGGQREDEMFVVQQTIVPFVNTPIYTQAYTPNFAHVYTSYNAMHYATFLSGVNLSSAVQNQGQ